MYNNNLNNHWSIYPRSFNILIHIPRIIHQQSPPFFSRSPGTSVSKGVLSRDGQPASSKARLKQGLSSGLPPSFALASCTHSVRIVLENESLSLPLPLFADVARNRPNLRVPSVFHPTFFFLSFFFQINFNPRRGERPIVTLTRFLPRKRGLLRRGVWRKESGTFLFDSLCVVFDLVCSPRWGGMFIRKKESVFFEEGWDCIIFYENGGVHLVDFNDSAPGLK